jgi:hypothetical protein
MGWDIARTHLEKGWYGFGHSWDPPPPLQLEKEGHERCFLSTLLLRETRLRYNFFFSNICTVHKATKEYLPLLYFGDLLIKE